MSTNKNAISWCLLWHGFQKLKLDFLMSRSAWNAVPETLSAQQPAGNAVL